MRILHVIDMGTTCGGAERLVAGLTAAQRALGNEVRVLSTDLPGSGTVFSDVRWPCPPPRGAWQRVLRQFRNPPAGTALAGLVRDWRPDVVHLHTITLIAPSSMRALARTPTVLTLHGHEPYLRGTVRWCIPGRYFHPTAILRDRLTRRGHAAMLAVQWVIGPRWRRALRVVEVVMAPSRYLAEMAARDFGEVRVVPNGGGLAGRTDPPPTGDGPRLLFFGRLEELKGVQVLLVALPTVLVDHPGARLVVCGSGPMEPELRRMADALGLGHAVEFVGWLDGDGLAARLAAAQIVVVPSMWPEAFGLTCLEALASGRAVVASSVGGLPDLVRNGETGLLVAPGDSIALAAAVKRLAADEPLRRRLGRAGRTLAAQYTMDRHAEAVHAAYRDALSRAGRPGDPSAGTGEVAVNQAGADASRRRAPIAVAERTAAPARDALKNSPMRRSAMLLLVAVLAADGLLCRHSGADRGAPAYRPDSARRPPDPAPVPLQPESSPAPGAARDGRGPAPRRHTVTRRSA
jgi:glycosyltransferase involved in cell wall biosynthesis